MLTRLCAQQLIFVKIVFQNFRLNWEKYCNLIGEISNKSEFQLPMQQWGSLLAGHALNKQLSLQYCICMINAFPHKNNFSIYLLELEDMTNFVTSCGHYVKLVGFVQEPIKLQGLVNQIAVTKTRIFVKLIANVLIFKIQKQVWKKHVWTKSYILFSAWDSFFSLICIPLGNLRYVFLYNTPYGLPHFSKWQRQEIN